MTINIGAVAITFIGLVAGLAGLGLAWRLVRGLPTDQDLANQAVAEDDEAEASAAEGTTNAESSADAGQSTDDD